MTLVSRVVVAALIIDADESARFAIENTLTPHGFVFRRSEDAPDAMHQACDVPPDIIFLRVELPSASGFSIFNKLKRHDSTRSIPIVMYASDVSNDVFERHKGLKTHADEYLRLPVDEGLLINAVHGLVEFTEQSPANQESLEVELSPIDGGLEDSIELEDIELVSESAIEEEAIAIGQDSMSAARPKIESFQHATPSQGAVAGQPGIAAPEFQAISQATDDAFDALTLVDDDEMPLEMTEPEPVAANDGLDSSEASNVTHDRQGQTNKTDSALGPEPLLFQETEEIETSLDDLAFEANPDDASSTELEAEQQQHEQAQIQEAAVDAPMPSPSPQQAATPSPINESVQDAEPELDLDIELTPESELNIELEPEHDLKSKSSSPSTLGEVRDASKRGQHSEAIEPESSTPDVQVDRPPQTSSTKNTEENSGYSSRREVLQFKSQLVQKDREILALREEIESAERQVLDEKHKNRELQAKLSELQGSKLNMEEQLLSAQEQADAATRDKSTILKREEGLKTRLEASQKKCRTLETENSQSQQAIAKAEEVASQRIQDIEREKSEIQQQVQALQNQVQETSQELKRTTKIADERSQELEVTKSQLSEVKDSVATLESDLKSSKQESAESLKAAEDKLTFHQQQFEASQQQLIEEHKDTIEKIRVENQRALEQLQSEKKDAEEKASSTIEEQKATLLQTNEQLDQLRQETQEQSKAIEKIQSELEGYRQRLTTAESDLEDTQSNFAKVSQQLADRENTLTQAQQALTGALKILEQSRN